MIGAVSLVLAFAINGATAVVLADFETESGCNGSIGHGITWVMAREQVGLSPIPFPIKGMQLVCRVNT